MGHWNTVEPRPYLSSDQAACLAVFDSLGLSGRDVFEQYLAAQPANFTVLEHAASLVGCGGFDIDPEGAATLHHGMIRKDFARLGLGRFLLMFRLRQISPHNIPLVRLSAPPESAGFFLKQGFKTLDGVNFFMKLTVCP